MIDNRGRKAASSVRPNTRERAGGALARGGLRLPFGLQGSWGRLPGRTGPPGRRAARHDGLFSDRRLPRRRDRRLFPGKLHAEAVPYTRAGKSWRLVREKISKEGVGDEPGAAPGSPPSSGGTAVCAPAVSGRGALSPAYPMVGLALGFAWFSEEGKGEGGRTQADLRTAVLSGGRPTGVPRPGRRAVSDTASWSRRRGSLTSGMEGVRGALRHTLLGGWGPGPTPGAPQGSGDHRRSRPGRRRAVPRRKAPFSASFRALARRGVRGPPPHHDHRLPLAIPHP